MGPSLRQGPHHSAQKSTMTGFSEANTSVLKLASVTSFALLITFPFVWLLGCSLGVQVCEVVLYVKGSHTTGARSGDGLAVRGVDDIARGEDTLDVGSGATAFYGDGSLGGQINLALDEIRAGGRCRWPRTRR